MAEARTLWGVSQSVEVLQERKITTTCEFLCPRCPNQRLCWLDLRSLLELFTCFFLSHGFILPRFPSGMATGVFIEEFLNRKGCLRRGRQPDSRSCDFLATSITLSSRAASLIPASWTS